MLWLKEKKSCHKNLILGKHILCLHKIATMGPASIISVVCAFNCFSNNSERGHTIDPNQYFTLSFWDEKIKVTLESDATKTVIFCLWLHPKPWEMCSICSALEPSPPRRLVFGLSFPSKLTCAVLGVCNVDHFFKAFIEFVTISHLFLCFGSLGTRHVES